MFGFIHSSESKHFCHANSVERITGALYTIIPPDTPTFVVIFMPERASQQMVFGREYLG